MFKRKIGIVAIIILALVLLVPTPIAYYDGGTVEYRAVLYSVINYHALNGDGFDTGIGIKVLGMMIYENKIFTKAAIEYDVIMNLPDERQDEVCVF